MDKAFVSPFLFDIKRSEVDGPILQFQSTVFEKDDLKKLVETLNKACEKDGLTLDRLQETFEVWYPNLESKLEKLRDVQPDAQEADDATDVQTPKTQEILEEVLELTRVNQKLLRSPELATGIDFEQMSRHVDLLVKRIGTSGDTGDTMSARRLARHSSAMLKDMMSASVFSTRGYVGVRAALGFIRSQYPWICDVGIETINILQSSGRKVSEKREAIQQFAHILDFLISHPSMRDVHRGSDDIYYFARAIQKMLIEAFERSTNR